MCREDLNEIYKKLESKMHDITALLTSLHNGFDFTCGYFNGHYHKDANGKYVMDYFPIPVITVNGLCDIEIDLEKISISTKVKRETALKYEYEKLSEYVFEAYGVEGYLDDFYVEGNTYAELVNNIENSKEKEIGFSFMFSGDVGVEEVYKAVKFLRREGFVY